MTISNLPSEEEILKIIGDFGRQDAEGGDAQIKSALYILDMAFRGAVTLQKDANGLDMAHKATDNYLSTRGKHGMFNRKSDKYQKMASNNRKLIKLGLMTGLGQGEPLSNVNDLMSEWRKVKAQGVVGLDDALNTLMRYATQQLRTKTLIVGDELRSFIRTRDTKEPKTIADVFVGIAKTVQRLQNGKIKGLGVFNDPKTSDIVNACTEILDRVKSQQP